MPDKRVGAYGQRREVLSPGVIRDQEHLAHLRQHQDAGGPRFGHPGEPVPGRDRQGQPGGRHQQLRPEPDKGKRE